MDYVSFVVDNSADDFKISFGSGLSSRFPTKSPLQRNLVYTCQGDEDDDIKGDE
jgi:hypothetical protein